jgi:hypothetical protein
MDYWTEERTRKLSYTTNMEQIMQCLLAEMKAI